MVEVTAVYTALAALLIVFLAYRVVSVRRRHKVGIGDGDNKDLRLAVRVHGNAVEYIPITLLLILAAELNGLPALWLHLAGITLIASRLAHAWGLTQARGGVSAYRVFGIAGNWLLIVLLAVINLWFAVC